MPDLVYDFTFPRQALGLDVVVTDKAGSVVSIEGDPTLVLTAVNGNTYLRLTLNDANAPYSGSAIVAAPRLGEGAFSTQGTVVLGASIEAGGSGVAADETAYFVGTGSGDTSGDQHTITFVQHPDYDAVDWASVVDGKIIAEGPVIIDSMLYRYEATMDFTEATDFSTATSSPDTDVTVLISRDGGPYDGNIGGPYYFVPTGTPGEVFQAHAVEEGLTQDKRTSANVELGITATLNCLAYDAAGDPVTDGQVDGTFVLAMHRATLPTMPD